MPQEFQVERAGAVGQITLDPPEAHHTLNGSPMRELGEAHQAFERRLLLASFAIGGQKEGMQVFIEKRPPVWRHR